MNKIKQFFKNIWSKICQFFRWIKSNSKKVLVGAGVVGVAMAAGIADRPEKIPSIQVEGQTISFPYTDDNSKEDILIYSDQEEYHPLWAWNGFDVYVAVENKSGKSQSLSFQSFFSKDFSIEEVSLLDPVTTTTIKEFVYENICEEVATSSGATSTVCRQEKTGEIEKVVLGVWNKISQQQFSKETYDKTISDNKISVKQKTGDKISGNFTDYSTKDKFSYYKLKIKANENFNREEFFIEAVGNSGAYGLLDPTILTENFNSYNDGELNGQGGWSGDTGVYSIQGTTVYEGAKAVYFTNSSGIKYILKTGDATQTGRISFYVRPTVASKEFEVRLREGATSKIYFRVRDTNKFAYYIGTDVYEIKAWAINNWYLIEIEWRVSDSKARYRMTAMPGTPGAWDVDWTLTEGTWTTGIDTVRLMVENQTGYFDYIAENPYVAPTTATSANQVIIIE